MDKNHFQAEILKTLGQPTRLKIIDFLRNGERCVCEIFPAISEEQSNTSRHLNLMVSSGILFRRKEGVKIFYAVKHHEIFEIVDLAAMIMTEEITGRHKLLLAA
ncbi:MAG: helix-turn-helix transcriptional regulator [Geobacteraceae bacterium]|nr:helix-turn-helix transcriptional regulator [Geobacteraceae bacterium]NTW78869.1 helix-turn-helix transcriptional regulator [Geobacteraceae bacterium]